MHGNATSLHPSAASVLVSILALRYTDARMHGTVGHNKQTDAVPPLHKEQTLHVAFLPAWQVDYW
jgi:hypothetical protein